MAEMPDENSDSEGDGATTDAMVSSSSASTSTGKAALAVDAAWRRQDKLLAKRKAREEAKQRRKRTWRGRSTRSANKTVGQPQLLLLLLGVACHRCLGRAVSGAASCCGYLPASHDSVLQCLRAAVLVAWRLRRIRRLKKAASSSTCMRSASSQTRWDKNRCTKRSSSLATGTWP